MISESRDIHLKVAEYFEILDLSLSLEDYDKVEIYLSRLSPYFEYFTGEQLDLYELATTELMREEDSNMYEPSELDEWHDYDPDC